MLTLGLEKLKPHLAYLLWLVVLNGFTMMQRIVDIG